MSEKCEKEYVIRTYECDKNNNLRILTLMNIFQDIADTHASLLGVGLEFCLERGLAWVGGGYHLKIDRLPIMGEKIKIISWPSAQNKLTAIREFKIVNESGETLVVASSQWILINVEKKRPVALADNLPVYEVDTTQALPSDFAKLDDLKKIDLETKFKARFDDIDLNVHVNNAVYPLWATESVENEFRLHHNPCEIEINFKKEGCYGEKIYVQTEMNNEISLHSIQGEDRRELAKVRIHWRKTDFEKNITCR